MGIAGAGFGAAQTLEKIIAEQMLRGQMQAREREAATRSQIDRDALNERIRSSQVDEGHRQQQIDIGDRDRRDRSNARGLDLMKADKQEMDVESAIAGLPEHLKPAAGLFRIGAMRDMGAADLQSPDDRAASESAKKTAEFDEWKKKQDYDENQIRSRPKEAPAAKQAGPGGLSSAQGNTALKFQDDYARDSKPYIVMRDAYQRVKSAASKPDAAGDLSMIFAYMKMLDPNSVVREQEYANAQNAAGVPDRIRNAYNYVMEGNRLAPKQREQFIGQAESLFANAKANQQKVRKTYGSRAKQWEIPESMVLDDDDEPAQTEEKPKSKYTIVRKQ